MREQTVFVRHKPWWHSVKMLRCRKCKAGIRWVEKSERHDLRRTLCDDCSQEN